MNKTTEALKLCVEALPNILFAATERDKKNRIRMFDNCVYQAQEALDVGREALAEHELYEPEGRCKECLAYNGHLDYCSKASQVSAKREWVDLTPIELAEAFSDKGSADAGIRAVIAAFKEKNK